MTAALRIEHVGKVFGAGEIAVRAVDDVSLSVAAGEMVLVMGPSGSGKTTLLSIAGALLAPDEGRVWIAGHEATSLDERALPELRLHSVGFIFQTANLLANLTASENVELVLRAAGARRAEARRHARDLLVELGLAKRLASLPEELSGGERQRVAIARALANEPALLLADEPTANLDSRTGYEVMHTLELLAKEHGRSLVAVTHDSRIADVADRVLWLEDGRLSEQPAAESATAVDPVCGMTIAIDRAAASRLRNDETLYFCSTVCVERFDRSRAIVVR